MLKALTARELQDWRLYYAIRLQEPEEERAELRHGIVCSLIDACHRAEGSPLPPQAYMPFVATATPIGEQSSEDQQAIFATAQGGFARAQGTQH